jgi:hypothetical protein
MTLFLFNLNAVLYAGTSRQRSDSAIVDIANVTAAWEENNGGASPLDVAILTASTAIISAATATKRATIFYNPSSNLNSFRVGVGAALGRGLLIEPGMGGELDGSMAVSAYNEGATTEKITVTELDRI